MALARGVAGARSASGRVAVVVLCGSLEVAFIAAWIAAIRRRAPRIWTFGLTIAGTDSVIVLGFFSRNAVREAFRARGWRFD